MEEKIVCPKCKGLKKITSPDRTRKWYSCKKKGVAGVAGCAED